MLFFGKRSRTEIFSLYTFYYLPEPKEISKINTGILFNGFKEGDAYTVGCWINESTKVRIK